MRHTLAAQALGTLLLLERARSGETSSFIVRGHLASLLLRAHGKEGGLLEGASHPEIVVALEGLSTHPSIVRAEVPRGYEEGPLVYLSTLEGARSPEFHGPEFHYAIRETAAAATVLQGGASC